MRNNLFAEAINGYNMGDPKHGQLFILVHMNLLTHVICLIWCGVEIAGTLKDQKIMKHNNKIPYLNSEMIAGKINRK